MNISHVRNLRKIVIPLLKKINPGTIAIKHHYTGNKFVLDAFAHKGYWYYGKNREIETMKMFEMLIKPGSIVVEIGGHIGYITQLFSSLSSERGKVYVFEPGNNNLPYIKENIKDLKNVTLTEKAVSDKNGKANFYTENISGQNNSLLANYGQGVEKNSYVSRDEKIIEVETITLDTFCVQKHVNPDFIKIDIEGAEIMALGGMKSVLNDISPILMIEVTKRKEEVFNMVRSANYSLFDPVKRIFINGNGHYGNTFCFHNIRHAQKIKELKQDN